MDSHLFSDSVDVAFVYLFHKLHTLNYILSTCLNEFKRLYLWYILWLMHHSPWVVDISRPWAKLRCDDVTETSMGILRERLNISVICNDYYIVISTFIKVWYECWVILYMYHSAFTYNIMLLFLQLRVIFKSIVLCEEKHLMSVNN